MLFEIEGFLGQNIFANVSQLETSGVNSKIIGTQEEKRQEMDDIPPPPAPTAPTAPISQPSPPQLNKIESGMMRLPQTMQDIDMKKKSSIPEVDIVPVALQQTIKRQSQIEN